MRTPRKLRPLRALQVEVTSRCTRSCRICPRTTLAEKWLNGDLSSALWPKLEPKLELAQHVHLQGWGEPLLHPDLPAMVQRARAANCSVGITTNGDLLDAALDWIVRAEVDLITLSVAGREATHAYLRAGSQLGDIWATVAALVKRRGRKRAPRVQVSYLLTSTNAAELPSVVTEASSAGVDELFVIHLDCTPSSELLQTAAFSADGLLPGVAESVHTAQIAAGRSRLAFRGPSLQAEPMLTCASTRYDSPLWRGTAGSALA